MWYKYDVIIETSVYVLDGNSTSLKINSQRLRFRQVHRRGMSLDEMVFVAVLSGKITCPVIKIRSLNGS